ISFAPSDNWWYKTVAEITLTPLLNDGDKTMRNRQLSVIQGFCALLLFVAGLIAPVQAQRTAEDRDERLARFSWEGVIDGTTLIRISRRRVDYEYSNG